MKKFNTEFQNNHYLIVGASKGIGSYVAKELIKNNAKVIAISRNINDLNEEFQSYMNELQSFYEIDASNEDDMKKLSAIILDRKIKLSGIFCSAGMHLVKPIKVSKSKDYLKLLEQNILPSTNILSNFQKVLEDGSSIVLSGSSAINRASQAVSHYVTAKSALKGLTISAALELSPRKIRVNLIQPGVVLTKTTDKFFSIIGEEAKDNIITRHPLGLGNSEDVSNLVLFLLSKKSKWLTGQSINIDGGFSIQG